MSFLGNLQLLLLAGVAFSLVASALVSAALPFVVRYTWAWEPASRHHALLITGLSPLALSLAALVSVLSPSLLAFAWPGLDHCLVHEGHAHLCLVHLSPDAGTWWGWVVISASAIGLAVRLGGRASALLNGSALLNRLSLAARFDAGRGAWVVPALQPFCLSAGLFRPRVLVSQGLLASASAEELEVMLAHEVAHVRRKDTLARAYVRAASLLLVPRVRSLLLVTLELSAEQACDEAAARQVGDRLRVAETIVAMERRLASATSDAAMAAGFGASSVSQRVESMLLPPRQAGASSLLALLFVGAVVGVLAASSRLHHLTESTLAFLAH